MSRARGQSHVYLVANDTANASERLVWGWGQERRQSWALDNKPARPLAQLYAERARLVASLPPDRSAQLQAARDDLARLEADLAQLYDGTGRWAAHSAGQAARAAREAAAEHQKAKERADSNGPGLRARHKAKRDLAEAGARSGQAQEAWRYWGEPQARSLEAERRRPSHLHHDRGYNHERGADVGIDL